MTMSHALLLAAILFLALQAIRTKRLLHSAIWLAGMSALLSVLFYQMGAFYVAVIELSVGAGLVTVLFIFAIGIAGEDDMRLPMLIPRGIAWSLVLAAVVLLGMLMLPEVNEAWFLRPDLGAAEVQVGAAPSTETTLQAVIWQERGLDLLVQMVLIFSGVMGLLGLLAELKAPLQQPVADEIAARRERELQALEEQIRQKERELA